MNKRIGKLSYLIALCCMALSLAAASSCIFSMALPAEGTAEAQDTEEIPESERLVAYSPYTLYREAAEEDNGELPLGNLISDAYLYTANENRKIGEAKCDIAFVSSAVIANPLLKGVISEEDIRDIMPYGRSADGTYGYPLVRLKMSAAELSLAAELDCCDSFGLGNSRLYFSGLRYTSSPKRIILNDVLSVEVAGEGRDEYLASDPNEEYIVVSDTGSLRTLEQLKRATNSLLELEPVYADGRGNPVENAADAYIKSLESGENIRGGGALQEYLESLPIYTQGLPGVTKYYSETRGRKLALGDEEASYGDMLKNLNRAGKLIVGLFIFALALLLALAYIVIKKISNRRKPRVIYVRNFKYDEKRRK